jgi:1-acyl-sn-glycerol-3-phosphate acyltransferase
VLVCSNHISHFDPLTLAHFIYESGRNPRFLAKSSLFQVPVIGPVLKGAGQIPVYRDSADAAQALSAAIRAVDEGHCVALYPEGTLTHDPHLWPMSGKTGAARIALTTSASVIPVAQWGPHEVMPPGARLPRLLPRRTMHVAAGQPVDLSAFAGREVDADLLRDVTEEIMAAITTLLAPMRHEAAPVVRTQRLRTVRKAIDDRRPRLKKGRAA